MVDIDPGYRWSTTWPPSTPDELVHESYGTNVIHDDGAAAAMLDEVFSTAVHVVEESVYQQAYAAVPIETRSLVVEYEPGVGEITMWVATQAPRAPGRSALASQHARTPRHRRDTGGGFGQKIFVLREEMAVMWPPPGAAALKWIETVART